MLIRIARRCSNQSSRDGIDRTTTIELIAGEPPNPVAKGSVIGFGTGRYPDPHDRAWTYSYTDADGNPVIDLTRLTRSEAEANCIYSVRSVVEQLATRAILN